MISPQNILQTVLIIAAVSLSRAEARPEYATKEKLNCMACHVTPWGGGPRNVFGKGYGTHGGIASKLNATDLVYADLRALAYYPTDKVAQTRNGVVLMQAAVTGNAAVVSNEKNNSEVRAVLTYNIAPVSQSQLREAYIRFQGPALNPQRAPQLLVGRFYSPFGLLTDEHRTYTRLQTNTTFNNYNVGLGGSISPLADTRLDAIAVNDFQRSGDFNNGDVTWGGVLNARWNPADLPFMLGISGMYQHTSALADPLASSVYAVLSLNRITNDKLSGSLLFERVDAKHWNNPALNTGSINPGLSSFFLVNQTATAAEPLVRAHSIGYYSMARLDLTHWLTAFYKLDWLDLDAGRRNGRFSRHGVGVETDISPNIIVNARYEKAYTGVPAARALNSLAAQDNVFLMFRFWL